MPYHNNKSAQYSPLLSGETNSSNKDEIEAFSTALTDTCKKFLFVVILGQIYDLLSIAIVTYQNDSSSSVAEYFNGNFYKFLFSSPTVMFILQILVAVSIMSLALYGIVLRNFSLIKIVKMFLTAAICANVTYIVLLCIGLVLVNRSIANCEQYYVDENISEDDVEKCIGFFKGFFGLDSETIFANLFWIASNTLSIWVTGLLTVGPVTMLHAYGFDLSSKVLSEELQKDSFSSSSTAVAAAESV